MAVAELLRSARARRGLTLEHVANQTKIGLDHLAAFERDGLARDGGFYQRARLRSYAEALGLDYRVVLEQLDEEIRAAAPPRAAPEPPAPLPRRLGVSHVALTAAASVVLAMIATAWLGRESRQTARPASVVRSAPHAAARPVAVAVADRSPSATSSVVPPVSVTVPRTSISGVDVVERTPVPVETTGVVAPAAPTSLVIVTQPEGARVTVDGIGWGTTPVTIPNLPEGLKRIRVTSDGFVAAERAIELQRNRANQIVLQLEPLAPEREP